jgi:hypothetical protein
MFLEEFTKVRILFQITSVIHQGWLIGQSVRDCGMGISELSPGSKARTINVTAVRGCEHYRCIAALDDA